MLLKSKGVALVAVLGIIAVITVLVSVGLNFILSSSKLSYYAFSSIKATSYSDAGIQWAMHYIKNHNNPAAIPDWTFHNQNINFTVSQNVNDYTVNATSIYGEASKTIQAVINKDPSSGNVTLTSWKQLN